MDYKSDVKFTAKPAMFHDKDTGKDITYIDYAITLDGREFHIKFRQNDKSLVEYIITHNATDFDKD